MKEISFSINTIIERAYDDEKECIEDESSMKLNNFRVIEENHDIYKYYRKYKMTI
ncbi:hypothetical protein [Oceanobacillus profundus]|uniref:hypothetical protein n=1 Tax=Oceanobacillus profundus TaxID=372463 RepID=UPI001314075E|nr:hypothetical protein [Oceanobacillus profundus]MBR2246107.1 hypothetical protein [Bacilli bacterium]MBR3119778.1 hypothetical protein [Oceanobacillus sp.]